MTDRTDRTDNADSTDSTNITNPVPVYESVCELACEPVCNPTCTSLSPFNGYNGIKTYNPAIITSFTSIFSLAQTIAWYYRPIIICGGKPCKQDYWHTKTGNRAS